MAQINAQNVHPHISLIQSIKLVWHVRIRLDQIAWTANQDKNVLCVNQECL